MTATLAVSIGQHSDKGRKEINQDFHGAFVPTGPQLETKGIAIALADGISSSAVSQIASEAAVHGFLEDYYCTSEAWSVKTSAHKVLTAINSWLYAQSRRSEFGYERDRGYVCTFSALVLKSATAHLFHAGDARIYRLRGRSLEQLTTDHRLRVSQEVSYLSRALGLDPQLELDYHALQVEQGEVFLLATDGVYEFVSAGFVADTVTAQAGDLDAAARLLVEEALRNGSDDNLTAQLLRIDALPSRTSDEVYRQLTELPFPPLLEARMDFDGYRIVRELHASSRSHVYLAVDGDNGAQVVLKTPSIDLRGDAAYLERFLMEEWVARRLDSAHVLKPCAPDRRRSHLYVAFEYVEGQTLMQWMLDNPKASLEAVRDFVEQIARGLRAFHRMEMLHQDLRPHNVMIDANGTLRIIDFGATRIAGLAEIDSPIERQDLLGTAQYTAPEYFLGEPGTERSDQYSLAVIAYQMLTGKLPYGTAVARSRTRAQQGKLVYASVLEDDREIPAWMDDVLRKALHPNPLKRYEDLSEFVHDLRVPNQAFLNKTRLPLIERNPVAFWKGLCLVLAVVIVALLFR